MKYPFKKSQCEYLRHQASQRFDKIRGTWIDLGKWALPHRVKWMLSQTEGERNNHHIVDATHVLALRSYVAGFMEGNTSATRPWYHTGTSNPEVNMIPQNHQWLDLFTRKTLNVLSRSNFYHAAGAFYYDYGVFNSGAYYIEELPSNRLHFHNLMPGAYYVLDNGYGEATTLVREFSMSVKAIVDTYGKTKNGMPDWSNFSSWVRKMYEESNYSQMLDVVHVIQENTDFNPAEPQALLNKKWISKTYELGSVNGFYYQTGEEYGSGNTSTEEDEVFLNVTASKRKPFIVGKSSEDFEYGERGPTLDALGLIKSLNKKAIGKDQALEQMLRPALQGPARLKKSFITTASNSFVPLDPTSASQKGLRTIFEVNPAIGSLIQDVGDLRQQVDRLYYADFLLYLSRNPKTRTATETDAIVQEQQAIIGPNLQSLNFTHNIPVVEYVMDYVLDTDPDIPPPPPDLAGKFLRPEFISVFAQAQKAADLPVIDRYIAMIANVGQIRPEIWDKVNLDKLADLYEDRLYLPYGLNNPQAKTDAMREQAMAEADRVRQMDQIVKAAGAAKDVGLQVNNQTEE